MSAPLRSKPLLRLHGASFGYGRRTVLSGIDLEVASGAFLGVAGPNGSGKSTLLAGLLGLIAPQSGRVERITRAYGYVPQREALDPIFPLTALEVVHMGAYARLAGWRGLPPAERRRAHEMLARVGMSAEAARSFHALSGGQRQRVLIARALMMQPELLLLDEPTSGVDPGAEAMILALLVELVAAGMAVLLVSHAIATLRSSFDAVLWVDGGKVERRDSAEFLAPERLETLFVGRGRSED